jgi:hypothetical protein
MLLIMKARIIFLIIALTASSCLELNASEKTDTIRNPNDSVSNTGKVEKPVRLTPYHWNVIKFNPTPMLLWGDIKNITLSYERLIKKNQSVALQLGYLVLPKFTGDTLIMLFSSSAYSRQGINIAFDYRYYVSSLNRRPAPYGLYLGGYLSYYGFKFTNQLYPLENPSNQVGSLKGKLNMVNLGIEIGYQFVFWKRFSVDLLMFGPSLSIYSRLLESTGNLEKADFEQIDEELAQNLVDRFPVLKYFFGGETATFSESKVRLGSGFRYSIQFGVHF